METLVTSDFELLPAVGVPTLNEAVAVATRSGLSSCIQKKLPVDTALLALEAVEPVCDCFE